MSVAVNSIELPNGVRLPYIEQGDPAGIPVLLLHGITDSLGLVLVGSLATWQDHPDFVELWDSVVSTLTDPIDADFVRAFQESTLAQPVPPEFLETIVRESLKLPARVWRATLLEGLLKADFSGELAKIQAPTFASRP